MAKIAVSNFGKAGFEDEEKTWNFRMRTAGICTFGVIRAGGRAFSRDRHFAGGLRCDQNRGGEKHGHLFGGGFWCRFRGIGVSRHRHHGASVPFGWGFEAWRA